MKKVFFACALTSIAFLTQAQTSFGVKAGGNLFTFGGKDGKDLGSQKSRIAYHVGGFANIHISDMFSVQPELMYSAQGTKQEDSGDKVTWGLDYINVPVMFQYNNASGFYAELGPEVGFLINAKEKAKIGGSSSTTDVKDTFKSTNFSAGLGAGYICKSGLGFGARYNLGLINIVDDTNTDVKNSGFKLSVIYVFGKAGKTAKAK